MNDSLKFVWAYMIEEGRITNGEWNYYAGKFEILHKNYDYMAASKDMEVFRAKVKAVGVDWDKTKAPKSSQESSFEGTFNPSSDAETLLGTVVLKDGSETMIGVGNVEQRFSGYVEILRNLMEDTQRVKDILGE